MKNKTDWIHRKQDNLRRIKIIIIKFMIQWLGHFFLLFFFLFFHPISDTLKLLPWIKLQNNKNNSNNNSKNFEINPCHLIFFSLCNITSKQQLFCHLQHDIQHSAQLGGLLGKTVNDQHAQKVDDDPSRRVRRQVIEHVFVQRLHQHSRLWVGKRLHTQHKSMFSWVKVPVLSLKKLTQVLKEPTTEARRQEAQ